MFRGVSRLRPLLPGVRELMADDAYRQGQEEHRDEGEKGGDDVTALRKAR